MNRRAGAERRGNGPSLAVWKFASCDGCQLSLLDCELELLAVTLCVAIVGTYFLLNSENYNW